MGYEIRQGDVRLVQVDRIPAGAVKVDGLVLALGEASGHAHEVRPMTEGGAVQFVFDGVTYLDVTDEWAILEHTGAPGDHSCIGVPRGFYSYPAQREYAVGGERRVYD